MKFNKIILSGIILILFGGLLFITEVLTPFIRPITYLFVMGSSKGKDILFFVLMGLFLILSQLYKIKSEKLKLKFNNFLLIAIVCSIILFAIAILLDILLRLNLGIALNTIFVNVNPTESTTSILHSHLTKSVLGHLLVNTINPIIGSNINTASGLYTYISGFSIPIFILMVLLFISEVVALQKRDTLIVVLLSFFEAILFIGCFDGGIMGTPGALGLFGCIWIYANEKYILAYKYKVKKYGNPFSALKNYVVTYKHRTFWQKVKRFSPYIIGLIIILLRISISIVGAAPDYYEVNIYNPSENVNLTDDYPINYVSVEPNKISYHIDSSLNEENLTNQLLKSLNRSCDYYTISWNFYSYF